MQNQRAKKGSYKDESQATCEHYGSCTTDYVFMAHLCESLFAAGLQKIDDCGAFYLMRLVVPSAVKSAVSTGLICHNLEVFISLL